ncbi:MAG: ribosome maturation factor RimM [Candidatus Izemoplasmatales bacterium]|nr:ribosome maturation factor RimM [Candidatus Izemoplasmatales bacterium]
MNYVLVGKILSTHGLKGELKVLSSTDFKVERYGVGKTVFVKSEDGFSPFQVVTYRSHKGLDLISFQGYQDINLVNSFLGKEIYGIDIPRKHLKKNEYHIQDLIGLEVFQSNVQVGKIEDVRMYPAGDYLVIKTASDTKLVPFRDEFVLHVDLTHHRVEIVEMEGLL